MTKPAKLSPLDQGKAEYAAFLLKNSTLTKVGTLVVPPAVVTEMQLLAGLIETKEPEQDNSE